MVYAKSMDELVDMLELLYPELASVGLELKVAKMKLLTNANLETQCFAEVAGEFLEILQGEQTHRYLGRNLMGDLALRTIRSSTARCLGEISQGQTRHLKQTCVPQTEIEALRFGCFPDSNIWPRGCAID